MSVCQEIGEARINETNLDPVHFIPMKEPVIVCPNRHIIDKITHQQLIEGNAEAPCPFCRTVVFPIPQPAPWQKIVAYRIADILTGQTKEIAVLTGKITVGFAAAACLIGPSVKVIIQKAYQPGYLMSFICSPTPEKSYYDPSKNLKVVAITAIIAAGCCITVAKIAKVAWNRGKN